MPPARTSKDNAEFSADLQNRGKADHEADDDKKFGDGAAQFVYRVCLTGGPCVGKSSSQDALSKALVAAGYNVYFAPEVPTILMKGGCVYPGLEGKAALTTFESGIIQMQLQMKCSFVGIAASEMVMRLDPRMCIERTHRRYPSIALGTPWKFSMGIHRVQPECTRPH